MLNRRSLIVLLLALTAAAYWLGSRPKESATPPQQNKEAGEQPADDAPADSTTISAEEAQAAGIQVANAGPATVSETVTLTGRITLNQNTLAQVKARFPGMVREVKRGQGELVDVGDVLATVESNESLQPYPVKSPIAGVVLARNTNIGDVAGETPLFTIADISDVWAEFHVFPRDIDKLAAGQKVRVTSFEGKHAGESTIAVVLPLAESSSQTVIARATLLNPQNLWRSGMTVRGDVVIQQREVPVAVRTPAIQRMEGKAVVFVAEGDRYAMRPVTLGASDDRWTEILRGLQAGESYVSENSFIIKADIGKAGAEEE